MNSEPEQSFTVLAQRAREFQARGERGPAVDWARRAGSQVASCDGSGGEKEVLALLSTGTILSEAGFACEAGPALERALDLAKRACPPEDPIHGTLHNNLGQVEQARGNLDRARQLLEEAVRHRETHLPDTVQFAVALDNLGSVLCSLGELDRAEQAHRRALEIFQRVHGPLHKDVGTALGALSIICAQRGDLDTALAHRYRALDTHLRTCGLHDPETITDLASMAGLHLRGGDPERADESIGVLLTIDFQDRPASLRVLADRLQALAQTTFSGFQLASTERLCARAVQLLEGLMGPDAVETLEAVHLLATVQIAKNDPVEAERSLRRVLEGYRSRGLVEEAASAMISLAKAHRESGGHPLAERILAEAIEQLRAHPDSDRQQLASALGNLAELCFKRGDGPRASLLYAEALEALEADEHSIERPWLLHGRGMLAYHRGAYAEAQVDYEAARELWIARHSEDHPFLATTEANLALLHWATDEVEQAIACFSRAETLKERQARRTLTVGSEQKRSAYARDLQTDLHKAISFCFDVGPRRPEVARFGALSLLRGKGRLLDAVAHTQARLRESACPPERAAFEQLRQLRARIVEVMAPTLRGDRAPRELGELQRLSQEEERLETQLSRSGSLVGADLDEVTLEAVCERIPPDAVLVELVRYRPFERHRSGEWDSWSETRYAGLALRRSSEPAWFDLGPTVEADALAERWRRALSSSRADPAQVEVRGRMLYERIFAPMEAIIADAAPLLVAPEGALCLVPLGELKDPLGRALSERSLSYLTSARELLTANEGARTGEVAVFADVDFDAHIPAPSRAPIDLRGPRSTFGALPGTRQECDAIADTIEGVAIRVGREASVDNLLRLEGPAVLHVATHGFFWPMERPGAVPALDSISLGDETLFFTRGVEAPFAHPMYYSGLALAGANAGVDGAAPGLITARQMAELDLRGTQLVVLSACETGLGTVEMGEEFAGLRRALTIAGAASQVTSLWRVSDEATAVLMEHLYQFLGEGRGRAEALAMAQDEVRRDPQHPEWAHPFYWAAFVLSGRWGPVEPRLKVRVGKQGSQS